MADDPRIKPLRDSELVIALVGAVGTDLSKVIGFLTNRLRLFGYRTDIIKISQDVIPTIVTVPSYNTSREDERIDTLMSAGNRARELTGNNAILAMGAAARIAHCRPEKEEDKYVPRKAYIISSLKRPEEVALLRELYSESFYLFGIYADHERRLRYLVEDKGIENERAQALLIRDEHETGSYGQDTSGTFHLSDFYFNEEDEDRFKHSLWRVLNIMFGHPYQTPTFDEYAMFMAFCASLRSADLSRQVGAVVAKNEEIIATGANDCPRYGGGLYMCYYDKDAKEVVDKEGGRDYKIGYDSNKQEKERIISGIMRDVREGMKEEAVIASVEAALRNSGIKDITEYGRVVHAEMEALLSCARRHTSTQDADVYCTTFPCHNCAKHIIAAGIRRVVYVEPYPKSKAFDFHRDSIMPGFKEEEGAPGKVIFEPFVGVGPRRFIDLFSMNLGSGSPLVRKQDDGSTLHWEPGPEKALRIQMPPWSYIERETQLASAFDAYRKGAKK